eukprot:3893234-Amphidinium_carterae.1
MVGPKGRPQTTALKPAHAACCILSDHCECTAELMVSSDMCSIGKEFFGTMTTSMFTIFRCMIGAALSRRGVAHRSPCYCVQ